MLIKKHESKTNDIIMQKSFQPKLEESVAASAGGTYFWIFPLEISEGDTASGQIVLQLKYDTDQYDKHLRYSAGCDLSMKPNGCSS